jgi:hypothetical protein
MIGILIIPVKGIRNNSGRVLFLITFPGLVAARVGLNGERMSGRQYLKEER